MSVRGIQFVSVSMMFLYCTNAMAADPAVICESGKLKVAGKYGACRLTAESKAVKTGTAADYSKCESKFSDKWQKTEDKAAGACPSNEDESSMNARITGDAADIATLLAGGNLSYCGDGVIDAGEDCDFEPGGLGGETCLTQGQLLGGFLHCGADCQFDYSGCNGFKRVFLTSTVSDANLGGVAGADAICQARANFAGLPGTFKAWISAGDLTAFTDPATTFTQSTTPYVRVDGVVVAADWADLTDGTLDAPINIDELGVAHIDDSPAAWTATNTDGTAVVYDAGRLGILIPDCSDWTDSNGNAGIGVAVNTDSYWTRHEPVGDAVCSVNQRLYCFEQ